MKSYPSEDLTVTLFVGATGITSSSHVHVRHETVITSH